MYPFLFSVFLYFSTLCLAAESSDAGTALQRLIDGNRRFVSGQFIHKNLGLEALSQLKEGQEPFAVIVGCSDSRVPLEIIFDQGLGDLFVVRVAGNVIGPIELDSIEYAVEKLHSSLILVLGHENCGAVEAALHGQKYVPELENIYPLIASALKTCQVKNKTSQDFASEPGKGESEKTTLDTPAAKKELLMRAVQCNVKEGVNYLKSTTILAKRVCDNQLKIVGGYYDFDHGQFTLISE